jgi:hypothetical protein
LVPATEAGTGRGWAQDPKPVALTSDQKQQLEDRDRYAAQVQNLRQDGQLAEAVVAAVKKLAIERSVFGDFHENVGGSLDQLAELHAILGNLSTARKAGRDVLTIPCQALARPRRPTRCPVSVPGGCGGGTSSQVGQGGELSR